MRPRDQAPPQGHRHRKMPPPGGASHAATEHLGSRWRGPLERHRLRMRRLRLRWQATARRVRTHGTQPVYDTETRNCDTQINTKPRNSLSLHRPARFTRHRAASTGRRGDAPIVLIDWLALFHTSDRIVVTGHPRVCNVGGTTGQNAAICAWCVSMRADDETSSPSQKYPIACFSPVASQWKSSTVASTCVYRKPYRS